jgi:hypothetical protein
MISIASGYLGKVIQEKKKVRLLCEPQFNVIATVTDATPLGIAMKIVESDLEHYPVGRIIFFSASENFSFIEV